MNTITWNIQHLNSAMDGSGKLCKNKKYFHHNSMNGLFLIIYTMALMSPSHSTTHETYKISCSYSMTCTKCTSQGMCVWSLDQQECEYDENQKLNSSRLIASTIKDCPKFSVDKKNYYDDNGNNIQMEYIVEITNDLVGFINYLNNSTIYYGFQYSLVEPVKIINETKIVCLLTQKKVSHLPPDTYFMFIKFNDIMLRFDYIADHYFTFNKQQCATNEMSKSCATCGWNRYTFTYYLKLCSSDNTCEVSKDVYLKNSIYDQYFDPIATVMNECDEIKVTAVNPHLGPDTGGTIVTITVRNHRIFVDNRKLNVMVAGTVCVNPRTLGPETITCTTSKSDKTLSGPILVEYSGKGLQERVLTINSSQIFQFCPKPVLDADQLLLGVMSGGTSVPVRGNNFVKPCFAFLTRLYIELADGGRRYADSYCDRPVNNSYMVCRSPSLNGTGWNGDDSINGRQLNFGLNITFSNDFFSMNEPLSIVVHGPPLRYYVHPDPVLLDFEIDESGSVVVNGHHLQHFQPKDIEIRSVDSPLSVCIVVSVTRHSLVCKLTMSINALQVITVTFGNSLVFLVTRRTSLLESNRPDDPSNVPGWYLVIIAMSTVLVFVCVLACCLRMKHRDNVTENIHNSPVASTRSKDL